MHLKNFSLFKDQELGWKFSASYDLLSTRLVIPEARDPEEFALTMAGKKSNFQKSTFRKFGKHIGLNDKQIGTIFEKMMSKRKLFEQIISSSFLSEEMKESYLEIVEQRFRAFQQ